MKHLYKIFAVLSFILLHGCNGTPLNTQREKTPEELRAELKRKESDNPLQYLSDNDVRLTPQRKKIRNGGLFRDAEYASDGALINGSFRNSASLAKFKDITVKISYYSKRKTLIDTESYIIYEYYEPNSTKTFSLRTKTIPDAYDSFSFEITGATAVY